MGGGVEGRCSTTESTPTSCRDGMASPDVMYVVSECVGATGDLQGAIDDSILGWAVICTGLVGDLSLLSRP